MDDDGDEVPLERLFGAAAARILEASASAPTTNVTASSHSGRDLPARNGSSAFRSSSSSPVYMANGNGRGNGHANGNGSSSSYESSSPPSRIRDSSPTRDDEGAAWGVQASSSSSSSNNYSNGSSDYPRTSHASDALDSDSEYNSGSMSNEGFTPVVSFPSGFQEALKAAVARSGPDALSFQPKKEERRVSAQEELLATALAQSKLNLHKLVRLQQELESAVAVERQQVQRLMFALQKTTQDQAYYRTLAELLDERNERN